MLRGRDAPGYTGAFFLWKNDEGDDIIKELELLNKDEVI